MRKLHKNQNIRRKYFGVTTIRAVVRSKRNKIITRKKKMAVPQRSNVASLSDILLDIIKVENAKYEEFDYNHNPTLGDMYESLTEHVVKRMLPPNLDLKMVGGFIYDDNGYKSGEIDRMLVHGEGRQFGFTGKYEYHIKDVLVVFEVKKTLNKDAFEDAYQHLSGITSSYSQYFENHLENGGSINIDYAARSFAQLTGKPAPSQYSDIHSMTNEDALIFYTLVQDTYSPIKIIHGYNGYKTESGLRNVFLNYLEDKLKVPGFGVPYMPNLVTSDSFSLAKTTGMPFKTPRFDDGFWPVVCSSRDNVVYLMIEVIWTKISIYYNLAMPWGDDMDADVMVNLLSGKLVKDQASGMSGWQYSSLDLKESELRDVERLIPWEPVIVDDLFHSVILQIGMFGYIDSNGGYVEELSTRAGLTLDDFKKNLVGTNLVTIDQSGNIQFIWPTLIVADLGNNTYAISHERGKLELWCDRNDVEATFSSFIRVS
ncbi:hypothetical protein QUO03_004621 [Vibrio parahaemolyticus]|nr:hypothetical protein [Vibrio parahaemolyticus]